MRKLTMLIIIFCLVFFIGQNAMAIDWTTGAEIGIEWDAVAKINDADVISYIIYTKNIETESEKIYDTTQNTEALVKINEPEGPYYIGVSAYRTTVSNAEIEGEIAWSNEAENPFGLRFYVAPGKPSGLRTK